MGLFGFSDKTSSSSFVSQTTLINAVVMTQSPADHMSLISHLYPDVYAQMAPQTGEAKRRRRRRKKGKPEGEGGSRKRKLSEEQVNVLEVSFGDEHKLESDRKDRLAAELGLDPRQVAVWFQNRRARWKNKRLEEEYSKLKSLYDHAVVDKCGVESEVLKLKEQLSEAEKEIQRLSVSNRAGNSPSSSYSIDVTSVDQPQFFVDQFGVGGLDDMWYMPVENYGYDLWS